MPEKRIISYLKAGFLLHLITLFEAACFFSLFYWVDIGEWVRSDYTALKLVALSPVVGMPLFAQLDARSRYQNYKLIKDSLYQHGFQKRIIKPFIKSRCQRDAIRAAAGELGMLELCNECFKTAGYQWYHLLPDVVFDKPSVLLTRNFWLTTIFEKTYHPKIDYAKINFQVSAS